MGLANYGARFEVAPKGVRGRVYINGVDIAMVSVPGSGWKHVKGLKGEVDGVYKVGSNQWVDSPSQSVESSGMNWYRLQFPASLVSTFNSYDALVLDMSSMTKGFVWVNGHNLGRYWLTPAVSKACEECDYVGGYKETRCRIMCDQPSQKYYHVPLDWVKPKQGQEMIEVTVFEEVVGDVSGIKFTGVKMV